MPSAEYSADGITAILREVTTDVMEMSGIQFPATEIRVKTRQDRFGRPTFEAGIVYWSSQDLVETLPPPFVLPLRKTPRMRHAGCFAVTYSKSITYISRGDRI